MINPESNLPVQEREPADEVAPLPDAQPAAIVIPDDEAQTGFTIGH